MPAQEWLKRSTAPGLGGAPPPAQISEGGSVLHGHFARFDEWTKIVGDPGREPFMERIAPGAFAKTFRERGPSIRLLLNHGEDELGSRPIAAITELREDNIGAYYAADLLDGVPEMVVDGIRRGLYGSSFSFRVIREDFDPRPKRSYQNPDRIPERTVLEARVREFGPTPFPAYPSATTGLRGNAGDSLPVAAAKVVRVDVTAEAFEELVSARLADGLETGGALIGRCEGDTITVEHCFEDAFATREPRRITISKRHFATASTTDQLIGDWHTHPSGAEDPPIASEDDRDAWRSHARDIAPPCGLREWLALIAGPSPERRGWELESRAGNVIAPYRWRTPVLSAYLATPLGVKSVPVNVLAANSPGHLTTSVHLPPAWRLPRHDLSPSHVPACLLPRGSAA